MRLPSLAKAMRNSSERYFDIAYLGIFPVAHKSEGLNVLLCDTIKPLMGQGVTVSIHTTGRHATAVRHALEGNGVDVAKVKFCIYRVESITLILLSFLGSLRRKGQPSGKPGLLGRLKRGLSYIGRVSVLRLANWLLDLTLWNLPFKLLVLLVLLGPFFLLSSIIFGISSFFAIFGALGFLLALKLKTKAIRIARAQTANKPDLRDAIIRSLESLRASKHAYTLRLQGRAYAFEQERFARAVNRNKHVKRLFFFTAFEGSAIAKFKGATLAVFPDMVTALYPRRFVGAHNGPQLEEMRLTVSHANALVCYSDYVRDQQLLRIFSQEAKNRRIEVIPQGYFRVEDVGNTGKLDAKRELNTHRQLIINCFPSLLLYPPAVDFTQFEFILYPTIDRPHKNSITLVRAFSKLLREHHRNVKLVLTSPAPSADVRDYILANRLQYDVLYMPSVPLKVLDLLFRAASLMVHPSLAEGGDIFNFSRAAAVGTPALLADVPVVREMFERVSLPRSLYGDWVFDPINPSSLAQRIDEVLMNPLSISAAQQATAKELSSYSFEKMANNYLNLYESL